MPKVTDSVKRDVAMDCKAIVDLTVNGYDGEQNLEVLDRLESVIENEFDRLHEEFAESNHE